jgi:dihydrodipicolinate synthase/N-acetylneuraminate lyase
MTSWREHLAVGQVIPASPLALTEEGSWSQRYQRALVRYYLEAGAGGLAVGVHTTQFEIREPKHGLYEPVLEFVSGAIDETLEEGRSFVKVAGICGETAQAVAEARFAEGAGYHAGLLSLTAMKGNSEAAIVEHCRKVAEVIPVFGFYLQPDIGGLKLSYRFWREFAEIENVVAIKMAPFNRYYTIDVVRAVIEAGREDIALYTGNDDNIINDLLTPFEFGGVRRRIAGGLLGQWAVWTKRAVEILEEIKVLRAGETVPAEWLRKNIALTDANAVLFDAANGFRGTVPGVMEVLRRRGLLASRRCLDPGEVLSPGQAEEIDRVCAAYPWLTDDAFVDANVERWLS